MFMFLTAACLLESLTSLHAKSPAVSSLPSSKTEKPYHNPYNKSFVDVIKEDLRRNNDDYAGDDEYSSGETPPDTRRRLNDSSEAFIKTPLNIELTPSAATKKTTMFRSLMKDFLRKKKRERHTTRSNRTKHSAHKNKSTTGSKSTVTDEEQKTLANKWKLLLDKNNRLRTTTSSSRVMVSSSAMTMRMEHNIARTVATTTVRKTSPAATAQTRPHYRQAPTQTILPIRLAGPERKPPNADQLDMAPARGAYIHDLRLKGRFCHRHVLWPEGPKYDSKGETIMPAFNANLYKAKMSFAETVKPLFVLPRCCNCCKKSVLGCQ